MGPPLTVPPISSLPSNAPHTQPVRFLANEISISVSSPAGVGATVPPAPPSVPPVPSNPCSTLTAPQPSTKASSSSTPPPSTDKDTQPTLAFAEVQRSSVAPIPEKRPNPDMLLGRFDRLVLRRLFASWRWHARQRHWKKLAHAKDEQIVFLLSRLEESQSRGVTYCRRQRGRRVVASWRAFVEHQKAIRQIEADTRAASVARIQGRFLQGWREASRLAALERQATQHHSTVVLKACLDALAQHAASGAIQKQQIIARDLRTALSAWQYAARLKANTTQATQVATARQKRLVSCVMHEWHRQMIRSKELRAIEQDFARLSAANLLMRTFASWHAAMHDRIACRLLEQGIFAIETIRSLFEDNRRLAKLVDASLSVTEQVSQLRTSSDVNEKLLRKVLALVERPSAPQIAKKAGMEDIPDVFNRLTSVKKRERRIRGGRAGSGHAAETVEAAIEDDLCEHVRLNRCLTDVHGKADKGGGRDGDDGGDVSDVGDGCHSHHSKRDAVGSGARSNKLGSLATSVVSVSEREFFSLVKQVNSAFTDELGWTPSHIQD